MKKQYTLEELKAWAPEKRKKLYDNAKRHPDGAYIVELIEKNGLSLSSGGLSFDDPVHQRIVDIIWSVAGQKAAVEATKKGLPALCGVDMLLQAELGDLYHKHDLGTASAGSVVAELMRHLGYKEAGKGKCPPECTAKTGERWK